MQLARAFVDHLPAQRSLALVRRDDEAILLMVKGEISEQVGQEVIEVIQNLLDGGEGDQDWPPIPNAN